MSGSFLIVSDDDYYFDGELRGYASSLERILQLFGGRRDDFLIVDWDDPEAYVGGMQVTHAAAVPPTVPKINTSLRYVRTTRRGRSF